MCINVSRVMEFRVLGVLKIHIHINLAHFEDLALGLFTKYKQFPLSVLIFVQKLRHSKEIVIVCE